MPAFISHKSEDVGIYSAICLALDAATGVQRWDPSKMSRGESLAEQLRDAIRKCVFIATRRSIESPWCLAELGAFWGAGKRVLLFLGEPDLTDSVLPPQFKGDLKVNTAYELIDAVRTALADSESTAITEVTEPPYEFFETSGNFGPEKEWQRLLQGAERHFDIMGVALRAWRQTPGFSTTILEKARAGCYVRILLMHEDNEILSRLLFDERDLDSVVHDIKECYKYYSNLAAEEPKVQVRQIRHGTPHFFLTRTDRYAVIIQYLSSATWGSGPTWRCPSQSKLFNVAVKEFDHLWNAVTQKA